MQGRASGSRQQGGPAAKHESHDRAGKSPGAEHQGPQGMGMGFGAPELMEMAPDEFHMLGPRERQATILRMQGQVGNRATINRVFDTQLAPPAISPRNRSFAELIQDRDVGGIKN